MVAFLALLACGCSKSPTQFIAADVTAVEAGTNILFKSTVIDPSVISELLACFPEWEKTSVGGVPSELPDPYTYLLHFRGPDRTLDIKVHGPLPGLYPGLWRHSSGVHVYLEGGNPQKFHDLMMQLMKASNESVQATAGSSEEFGPTHSDSQQLRRAYTSPAARVLRTHPPRHRFASLTHDVPPLGPRDSNPP